MVFRPQLRETQGRKAVSGKERGGNEREEEKATRDYTSFLLFSSPVFLDADGEERRKRAAGAFT